MSKVLTISNPYAYLVAAGIKKIENRTWTTKYRGKILIHASAKWHKRGYSFSKLYTLEQFDSLTKETVNKIMGSYSFDYSAIIGEVTITDCIQGSKDIWAEKGEGIYHWVLENAILYEKPILNVKGKLQIWNYQPKTIEK